MKRVKNTSPRTLDGGPFLLPVVADDGQPVIEDGQVKNTEGDLIAILRMMVKFFPADKLTMHNIIHGKKVWDCLDASDGKVIVMDEGVHDWVRDQLKDEKVGVQMFRMNLMGVVEAIDILVPKDES